MINLFFQILIVGLAILIVAIFVNVLANLLGLETWYSFINKIQSDGLMNTIKEIRFNLIFLLIIYPFILGLAAYYFLKFTK